MADFLNIAEHEYHQDRGRFSCSFLDALDDDPRQARDMRQGKPEKPASEEMGFGKYGHMRLLEPRTVAGRIARAPTQHDAYRALTEAEQRWYDGQQRLTDEQRAWWLEYIELPKDEQSLAKGSKWTAEQKRIARACGKRVIERRQQDPSPEGAYKTMERTGNENKRMWADFEESARGMLIVKPEWEPRMGAIERAVANHPIASKLLDPKHLRPEVSVHWTDEATGCEFKGRFDGLTTAMRRTEHGPEDIVELKFTNLVDPSNINKWSAAGWARKAAVYLDAYKLKTGRPGRMWWIFIEPTDHDPRIYTCWVTEDHAFYRVGRDGTDRYQGYVDLAKWAQICVATDTWEQPWERVKDGSMVVPPWYMSMVERSEQVDGMVRAAGKSVNYGAT